MSSNNSFIGIENQYKAVEGFIQLIKQNSKFQSNRIPLCAAENIVSPLARIPLISDIQERYIMGGLFDFTPIDNFIGSEHLYPFYEQINQRCHSLYDSKYADARPLSGMNAIISLLMAITKRGDKVILQTPDSGGHPSYPEICKRLGLKATAMPYDYEKYNFDVTGINNLCQKEKFKAIILAPSDILFPPPIDKFELAEETIVIYDATQTLGLIGGKVLPNPLKQHEKLILLGGTHKTLPGPTNGLIMTNDYTLAHQIDESINPKFLRNTQMHQIASLLLCLIEFEIFGNEYSRKIVENANILGKELEKNGFQVTEVNKLFTSTHQIFILLDKKETDLLFKRSLYHGITLNDKHKRLFGNTGLRLGLQEVTRYKWGGTELRTIATLLRKMRINGYNEIEADKVIEKLSKKKRIQFTFEEEVVSKLRQELK